MLNLIEFVWIWNKTQGQSVPSHHAHMCRFLTDILTQRDARHGLLMAFRNSGKSTLVGLFCAWVLLMNPDARILILSADHALAKKMVRNIKKVLETHPLTKPLIPAKKDEWASDRFTVVRGKNLRDPSVLARGLGANMTGCRADVIVCDDVEVPKTCITASKRSDSRQKLSELDYILTPRGMMLYVGTPHTEHTIYDPSAEGFLNGFGVLKIPILDAHGRSNWPERFPISKINEIKKRTGPHKFLSQMMLEPVGLTAARLDANLVKFYDGALDYSERNGVAELRLNGIKMRSVSCFWDPSFASSDAQDDSVIACVFSDDAGEYYIHDVVCLKVPDGAESATWQCANAADFIERNFIPCVHLETNGLGKFLPAVLRREIARRRLPCTVVETHARQNKTARILSAFDAPLCNGAIHAHERVRTSLLIAQMQEWTPESRGKDDALDAVAGCLLNEPARMSRLPQMYHTRKEWRF